MAFRSVLPTSTGSTYYGYGAIASAGAYGTGPYGGLNDSGYPLIEVQIDYQNNPTSSTTTWTDITPWVVSYARSPVRETEFDQPGPATATIMLRNDDYRFTQENTSGPYRLLGVGNAGLLPFRRIRVNANWNGVIYNRFYGYVTGWPQAWDQVGTDSTVTLTAVDNQAPFETQDLYGFGLPLRVSGTAIADVISDTFSVSATPPLALDTGVSTIPNPGTLSPGAYASQRLKDICATENGFFFAAGDGTLTFHDRNHRTTATRSTNIQATLGDTGVSSELPYKDPQFTPSNLWTVVQITPNGGTVQVASNSGGRASFFNRILNWPVAGTYLVTSSTEALNAATFFAAIYGGDRGSYISRVTLVGANLAAGTNSPNLAWPKILGLDTSDWVVIKRHPPVGATITKNMMVEGYGDNVRIGQGWDVTLAMSPRQGSTY